MLFYLLQAHIHVYLSEVLFLVQRRSVIFMLTAANQLYLNVSNALYCTACDSIAKAESSWTLQ